LSSARNFTVEEARKLVPRLRQLILDANEELEILSRRLEHTNARFNLAEKKLEGLKPAPTDEEEIDELRAVRLEFQSAIESLSQAQQEYLVRLNHWVDNITDTGVILRDLRSGLLDFPARQDSFEYYLCWKLSDSDIDYWHPLNDGYVGRRPLAVLSEYF
jgi:hypothetical protein